MNHLFDRNRWQEIWQAIVSNKTRSVLTAFGIFWGMFMLVVMLGAGTTVQNNIMSLVEDIAPNTCHFFPNTTSEPYKGFKEGRNWYIVNEDMAIIRKQLDEVEHLSPMIFGSRASNNVVFENMRGSYYVKGVYPNHHLIEKGRLIQGRFINDIDIAEKRKVCVIGERVYEVLLKKEAHVLGKEIRVNGVYFQVVGVVKGAKSTNVGGSGAESVLLPFSTMQQVFQMRNRIDILAVTVKPGVKVSSVEEKIKEILKAQHFIAPTDNSALWSFNIEKQLKIFSSLTVGILVLIWIVGLGTLFSGAIGVSNIMLVTVHERTKEIGIRRAIGATPKDIVFQIISESAILTLIAGIVGLMTGVGLLQFTEMLLEGAADGIIKPQISFTVSIVSLFILVFIGMGAGLIPAKRAIKIKAIEAIREE